MRNKRIKHLLIPKFILETVFVFLAALSVVANDNISSYAPRDYSIIPPSPEVSSLINFYDIPVDYFHGLPDITLPIYELTQGSLKVPVSIRYHGAQKLPYPNLGPGTAATVQDCRTVTLQLDNDFDAA